VYCIIIMSVMSRRLDRSYTTAAELKADFSSGALHPGDLKPALARQLNAILQPVRDHFERDDRAKDLLKQVKVSDCAAALLRSIVNKVQRDLLKENLF